jgi:hypothetical protein
MRKSHLKIDYSKESIGVYSTNKLILHTFKILFKLELELLWFLMRSAIWLWGCTVMSSSHFSLFQDELDTEILV